MRNEEVENGPRQVAKGAQSPAWLCWVFPPAVAWRRGWIPFIFTTLLTLYGWAPGIPAALYYNSAEN